VLRRPVYVRISVKGYTGIMVWMTRKEKVGEKGRAGGYVREGGKGTSYFVPSRSISPYLNQLRIEVESFLVDISAVEF
jgi:hypothetical protein